MVCSYPYTGEKLPIWSCSLMVRTRGFHPRNVEFDSPQDYQVARSTRDRCIRTTKHKLAGCKRYFSERPNRGVVCVDSKRMPITYLKHSAPLKAQIIVANADHTVKSVIN